MESRKTVVLATLILTVVAPSFAQTGSLVLNTETVFENVQPGQTATLRATLDGGGYVRETNVTLRADVIASDGETVASNTQNFYMSSDVVTKTISVRLPDEISSGDYTFQASANYTGSESSSSSATSFSVSTPFLSKTVAGLTYSRLLQVLFIVTVFGSSGGYYYLYRKKQEEKKKRYSENIDLETVPKGGHRQGFIGQVAEMDEQTYLKIDDLMTHALIAGATGSGKTVTGQVFVEEALKRGANVIVLDPTAQWTGFLNECNEDDMKKLYKKFGLSDSDAQGFDGNIRAVEPDQEEIDITPHLEAGEDEEGEIIVFSMHKMDSANIDEFVNDTIQQVFNANLPERNELETLIVYDEVHRLLDKFGGEGEGLKQLERGAREFRKWGVGMVLLSQVISDFSGEIRANIGTTVQMRTEYEDDLDRMRDKFGMDTVKSIAKAAIGSGMLQSSDYNHGRPYFVDFRPLLHSPHRLSDEQLEKYEQYNRRIDSIEEEIDRMEQEEGEEVYEYRSELKLAKKNLRKASFNLVDIYLDELEDDLGLENNS